MKISSALNRQRLALVLLLFCLGVFTLSCASSRDSSDLNLAEPSGAAKNERGNKNIGEDLDGNTIVDVNGTQYLIGQNTAVTQFSYSADAAEQYASAMNAFREAVDPTVRMYAMLAPSSAAFTENEKFKEMSDSQKDAFAHIYSLLDSGIDKVDIYDSLEKHGKEYVYFRTDHHLTALGAYYAYAELMKEMGEQPVALDSYKTGKIEGFLGSIYKATLSDNLKAHPDTITYYLPKGDYTYTAYNGNGASSERNAVDPHYASESTGFYAAFLGGDLPRGEIETKVGNGKRLLVVKDSYANALIPFLISHFESIDYIDIRYYEGNLIDYIAERRITDIVVLNGSTAARTNGLAKLLDEKIRNSQ